MLTKNLNTLNKVELSMNTNNRKINLATQTIIHNHRMNISEAQTITTTMMMTTTTTITKTKTMARTTKIKYQKTIQMVMHPMMIMMSMIAIRRITIKMIMTPQEAGIITPKMRSIKMIILMNLGVIVKIRMTSNKLKKILL